MHFLLMHRRMNKSGSKVSEHDGRPMQSRSPVCKCARAVTRDSCITDNANTHDTESLSGVFPQASMGGSRGLCCGACERGNSLLIEPATAGLVPFGHRAASAANRVGCLGLSECLGLGEDAVTVLHRHGGH